jgi:plastocyanin
MMRLLSWLTSITVVLAMAGCAYSSSSAGPNQSGGHTSGIALTSSLTFTPANDTVAVNTTVTWTWPGGTVVHNVTFEDGTVSPDQSSGTYARTFSQAGTYRYRRTHHSSSFTSGMAGRIVVQ